MNVFDKAPVVDKDAFVAPSASVIGIGSSIWYGCVLRDILSSKVWAGNPAKFLRKLADEQKAFISQSATNYTNLAQVHAAENSKPFDEIDFEKVLRKKFARIDEEYDSMLGVVREIPPELMLPDKAEKALQK
ncbi:Gamma carbonic anhydrase 1, mitochondrial [Glycine soja]|uniref:Gamma carbonic anhydrase 1, mitochondrial n=1 Tax=Glycine soja TaxID=3848 RepID=A0A445K405_GLYSO|nr:Gamma carbonic anhydrase 1, mitochondrial [Glycine soja]